MKLWPQTIMGRMLGVLLAGIVLSTLIAFAYQFLERRALILSIGGWHGVERIADIIIKVENAPASERAVLARTFETPGFRAAWSPDGVLAPIKLDWQGQQVRHMLEEFVGDIDQYSLRMEMASYRDAARAVPHTRLLEWRKRLEERGHSEMMGRMMQGRGGGFPRPNGATHDAAAALPVLLISYRLGDGSWLTFLTPPAPVRPLWAGRFFLPSALALLLVLTLSGWAVRSFTHPLGRFARAAQRLGLDVNAPPMNEDGPREVRRAAIAFNRMQRRLQAFVKDRTHMLAAISHDLRTPITRLRLRAEFIEDEQQRRKMLGDLDEMEAMIAATLQFARDDVTGEPSKAVDLAALVRGLCDDARAAGDDVSYSGAQTLAFLGREVGLKRMVSNLIGNAVRYGERARVKLDVDGDDVCLSVSDDGPGIAPEMMQRVFDPFVRVESSRSRETGGTGLGLTAVKTIVQAHGGQIDLINLQGGGFDVRVTLPQSD